MPFTTTVVKHNYLKILAHSSRSEKPSHKHTSMQILNPSTSAKPFMTKLQNLFFALVNMDIFQMTLKFSSFTVDYKCNFS